VDVVTSAVGDALRLITHLDVDDAGCDRAATVLNRIITDRSWWR
jgi:hypothetical protein